jgi:uncharacterized membrane protein YobD (UPF0266 family)
MYDMDYISLLSFVISFICWMYQIEKHKRIFFKNVFAYVKIPPRNGREKERGERIQLIFASANGSLTEADLLC